MYIAGMTGSAPNIRFPAIIARTNPVSSWSSVLFWSTSRKFALSAKEKMRVSEVCHLHLQAVHIVVKYQECINASLIAAIIFFATNTLENDKIPLSHSLFTTLSYVTQGHIKSVSPSPACCLQFSCLAGHGSVFLNFWIFANNNLIINAHKGVEASAHIPAYIHKENWHTQFARLFAICIQKLIRQL